MNKFIKTIPDAPVKEACKAIGVRYKEIKRKDRHRHLSDARHLIMFYLRNNGRYSLPTIGAYFNRDHTSVIMGIRKVNNLISYDGGFAEKYFLVKKAMDNAA